MAAPQVEMLSECVRVLEERFPMPRWAFLALTEWAGAHHSFVQERQLYLPSPAMPLEVAGQLEAIYDEELLREECWDWWGETAAALGLEGWTGAWPERAAVEETAARYAAGITRPHHTFFDKNANTGRLLLAVWDRCRTGIMLGVVRDRNPYRLCLLNMACQGIPSKVYRGSKNLADLGHPRWDLANLWGSAVVFRKGRPVSHRYNHLAALKAAKKKKEKNDD